MASLTEREQYACLVSLSNSGLRVGKQQIPGSKTAPDKPDTDRLQQLKYITRVT